MKRFVSVFVFIMMLIMGSYAQESFVGIDSSIEGSIYLEADISYFSGDLDLESYDESQYSILFGTLTKPNVLSDEPLLAVSQLMSGRWTDDGDISLESVDLIFDDDVFVDFIDYAAGKKVLVIAHLPTKNEDRVSLRVVSARILN